MHSDTSDFACGGHKLSVDSREFELHFHTFSSTQKAQDSNSRPFCTGLNPLTRSTWTTRTQPLFLVKSLCLHDLALQIFHFCACHNVCLEVEWIPRSLNEFIDSMSRIIDYDDWCISHQFFQYINSYFGPFSVDRFASSDTTKCCRFYSKFWWPGSEGVDAFSITWLGDNNWLVPPVHLVSHTILHLESCRASSTLLVPKWPSAVFWPILFPTHGLRSSVKQIVEFTSPTGIFTRAPSRLNTIFSTSRFTSSYRATWHLLVPPAYYLLSLFSPNLASTSLFPHSRPGRWTFCYHAIVSHIPSRATFLVNTHLRFILH